jgi:hypothetical protein
LTKNHLKFIPASASWYLPQQTIQTSNLGIEEQLDDESYCLVLPQQEGSEGKLSHFYIEILFTFKTEQATSY